MSAHDQIRNMLDQLMGTARNGDINPRVRFYDPKVCKSFLLGCCPHDILASTRMDIGECPKIHDLALRADFEQASKQKDYYYDIDAMEHLQSFINECDRRTELAKKRLAETQEELSAEVAAKANKVHELAELIGIKLSKAEELGAEGHVEESMQLMEEKTVEERREKRRLEREKEREKEALERAHRHHAKEKEKLYHRSRSPDRRHRHSASGHESKDRSRSSSKSHKSRSRSRDHRKERDSHSRDRKREEKKSRDASEKR